MPGDANPEEDWFHTSDDPFHAARKMPWFSDASDYEPSAANPVSDATGAEHDAVLERLRELLEATTGLEAEVAGLRLKLAELRNENTALREQLDSARSQARRTQERLDAVRSEQARQRVDIATVEDTRLSEIARDYRALVNQDVLHLARFAVAEQGQRPTAYDVAKLVRCLTAVLFATECLTGSALRNVVRKVLNARNINPAEIERMCQVGAELRGRSAAGEGEWFLDAELGAMLDPRTQEPWGSCDQGLPVRFVVTPGLTARGNLYCRQQVYTAPDPYVLPSH